jgi:hypothetical protein
MLSVKSLSILAGAVIAATVGLTVSQAKANVIDYSLTSDFCTGTCGTAPFGTVMATDIGTGEVQVTVTLTAGETFANTGAGGHNTLLFDLAGTPTLTDFTDVSSNVPIALVATTAGSIMADGSGTWQYAINCPTCGGGVSAPTLDSPITFDISATGLSTTSFAQNGNSLFFAADISGANGNTGVVGAPTAVPTPAPPIGRGLPVLLAVGGILFGAKLFERRKKRGYHGTAVPHAA